MDELTRRLAAGPSLFPHGLDLTKGLLLLVELAEAEIAGASFLDQRVLKPSTWGRWLPIGDIRERLDPASRDDAHYIFHIGHVGSTLVSRLVAAIGKTLPLREPLVLRDLATAGHPGAQLDREILLLVRRLLARSFRPDQRTVVKATSFVSDIAADLVSPDARALFLSISPTSYFATILAGDNSRRELEALAPMRVARLSARLGERPATLETREEGERLALAWLTETMALQAAADALPAGTVLPMDFDAFLDQPADSLLRIASHLGLTLAANRARDIVTGPIMGRYSKAPEHDYSTALRQQLQAQALCDHADTIRRALAWLDEAMQRYPAAARAATLFDGAR